MAKRAKVIVEGSNVSTEVVARDIMVEVFSLSEKKDEVSVGPVRIFQKAGRDTILAWPSLDDEKSRNRRGGEVDWFREQIDMTPQAKEIEEHIQALKDKPKNAVNDREMQTLRQRLSYAAATLRKCRGMASKMVECEMFGFAITLCNAERLTRNVYPITVIDDGKKGLPIQLSVRDFLNLKPEKGKLATDLEIGTVRVPDGDKLPEVEGVTLTADQIVEQAKLDPEFLADVLNVTAEYMGEAEKLPKRTLKKPATHLANVLLEYLGKRSVAA